MEIIHGIYQILNLRNGKSYIGQSYGKQGILGRWEGHRSDLRRGSTTNTKFLNAWRKYGEDSFDFRIVMVIPNKIEILDEAETYFIKLFDSIDNGYNLREGGNSARHSPSSTEKLKQSLHTYYSNQGNRNKASIAQRKRFAEQGVSKETRIKQSKSQTGRIHPDEVRKKIQVASLTSQRIRFDTQGVSEETRKKMSILRRGVKPSETVRQSRAEGVRKFHATQGFSEETRQRMSAAQKKRFAKTP
jgi:group I intron endonuclease